MPTNHPLEPAGRVFDLFYFGRSVFFWKYTHTHKLHWNHFQKNSENRTLRSQAVMSAK